MNGVLGSGYNVGGGAVANSSAGTSAVLSLRARGRTWHSFFTWMAALMLVINLVGFSRTYFLHNWFHEPALPFRLHVHGALFTSWFVLVLVQASLVARGKVSLHRRLGALGAALAVLIVPVTLTVVHLAWSRFLAAGGSEARVSAGVPGQLNLLAAYVTFVFCAMAWRRRADAHKRCMLLASLAVMPFSLGRFGHLEALRIGQSRELGEAVYGLGGLAVLLLVVIAHDVLTRRTVHPVVLWGASLLLGSILVSAFVLPQTAFVQTLVRLIW